MSTVLGLLQLIVFLGLVALAVWVIRRVQRHEHSRTAARVVLAVISLGLGVGACFVRYRPRQDLLIFGLPLPLAAFQRENGNWVDFVAPPLATLFMAVLNVLFVSGVVHGVGLLILRHRGVQAPAPLHE